MRRGLVGVLIATLALSLGAPADARVAFQPEQQVVVYILDGTTYEEAIGDRQIRRLASTGGIGHMAVGDDDQARNAVAGLEALGSGGADPGALGEALRNGGIETVTDDLGARMVQNARIVEFAPGEGAVEAPVVIRRRWTGSPNESVTVEDALLLLVVPAPSADMRRAGDEALPIILSYGHPEYGCLPVPDCIGGLTSNTTRRSGIVSNVDVAPTILEFLGLPIPGDMTGSPIVGTGRGRNYPPTQLRLGGPPTELHQRYLEYQQIHTPVGLLALAVVLATLFASVGVLVAKGKSPANVVRALGVLALVSV
ncbi:MAG TPA: hypothetical protein VFH75_07410, partial [Actinomycetota bacterium]|nr:hypothetical protein [Actinomycetota bacterium]